MRITNLIKTKLAGLLVVAICASLSVPALAFGQDVDPTGSQYDNELTQLNEELTQLNQGNGGNPPGDDNNGSGSGSASGLGGNVGPLPFTGFDVIAMAAVALAVTGLGLALQRAVSRNPA